MRARWTGAASLAPPTGSLLSDHPQPQTPGARVNQEQEAFSQLPETTPTDAHAAASTVCTALSAHSVLVQSAPCTTSHSRLAWVGTRCAGALLPWPLGGVTGVTWSLGKGVPEPLGGAGWGQGRRRKVREDR